jgi:hypothetical protein
MANTTKPRTNVEAKLYSGRGKTTYKTKDEHGNQGPPGDQHAPGYDNIVPDGRRSGDRNGVNPNFDVSDARRGNDKPISKGGDNCEKSPLSAASKAAKAESDWSADYKPRSYKG